MTLRFIGASLVALAIATPAFAQSGPVSAGDTPDQGVLDDLAPASGPSPQAAPAASGDPVLDRLNALEAKVKALEGRNTELETQLEATTDRVQHVEVKSARGLATNGVVPTFTDATGNVTFKVRGAIDADYVAFNERRGGYDYNNGTAFRRARLGFEGTAFKVFNWRIEADFAGNSVNLQDAYVQYAGFRNKALSVTLGQHKAPFGLESNNSDNYNVFLERGMFNNAAGTFSAERRIGVSAAYVTERFTATAGVFGENETIGRAANTTSATGSNPAGSAQSVVSATDTPDEGWGVNGRVTWEPVHDDGRILHLGVAGNWRTNLRTAASAGARLSDRPNVRVDNGNIIDSGVILDATDAWYLGTEAAGVWGPVTVAGEYGKLWINRAGGAPTATFDGFYVYGTVFLTGESRPFRNGNYDRVKPFNNFDGKGGWGAWEVALRYDEANLSDTPTSRAGNKAHSITAGVNWYWNPNIKLQFDYIRFSGDNTPLDPVGAKTKGDALATRLHIDW